MASEPLQIFTEPGVPTIRNINWGGLRTLYIKEVRRFLKVHTQTIWAPAITTLMYLVIFTVALGRNRAAVMGVSFADFLAPGLIIMGMMQNAFANSSFSLLVGKIQGTIVDYLMPPLSHIELLAGLTLGAVTRALMVGGAMWATILIGSFFWPGVHILPKFPLAVAYFGLAGSLMLALLGVLTSIWAEKFDHAAAVTNFVVAPLALLSGTFYSVDRLAPTVAAISRLNPFHYAISGFRYGFIGEADSSIWVGGVVLLLINAALGTLCFVLLRTGWKLKS